MSEPKTFTKTITKELDDTESAKLGRELCQTLEEIEVATKYRKEFNAEIKEKLDGLIIKRNALKDAIEAGKDEEHVVCYEVEDFDASAIHTVRKDTGVRVDTRAMTADERRKAMQMPLPIAADGGGPDAKVITFTAHTHDDVDNYTEGCTACWSTRERPPMPVVDDETALAESIGPGNVLPEQPPSDEELDAVDAEVNVAEPVVEDVEEEDDDIDEGGAAS
jgi:hypothetical protein